MKLIPAEDYQCSLTHREIVILGQYNAEIARGIVHTPEWDTKMALLQNQFDLDYENTCGRS